MRSNDSRPEKVVGKQLQRWRERRKLSGQALADRIAAEGGDLGRMAISKIENGNRGVSLDEWLQLAYALAVPPPLLFLDLESGTPVKIVPNAPVHPWLAWQWAIGEEPPVTADNKVKRVEEFSDALTVIRLYRDEAIAADAVHAAETAIAAAEYADSGDQLRQARRQHADALKTLAAVLDEMVERDVNPPGKPAVWIQLMQQLKLLKYPDRIQVFTGFGEERPNG